MEVSITKLTLIICAQKCILFSKLFLPSVRQNCSHDQEKALTIEAEVQEFSKILRSLEQFIQTLLMKHNEGIGRISVSLVVEF